MDQESVTESKIHLAVDSSEFHGEILFPKYGHVNLELCTFNKTFRCNFFDLIFIYLIIIVYLYFIFIIYLYFIIIIY